MSLSSVKSETTLRSRLFSSSRSFRRSPARSSAHRTPGATDNTSPRSPRSGGLRPPCSGPARPEHRPAAASQRSLQACIASLPLQSSWMSKTYLKSDHFNGGGSRRIPNKQILIDEIAAWEHDRNANHTKADWQFTTKNARIKLKHL